MEIQTYPANHKPHLKAQQEYYFQYRNLKIAMLKKIHRGEILCEKIICREVL